MSDITRNIRLAIYDARHALEEAQKGARSIGALASDEMILRNMSGGDLAKIKKQLQNFNAKTCTWKEER